MLPAVPQRPLSLDEVRETWPTLRQSLLSNFDDCELTALFGLRYEYGWSTAPAAAGTIGHRTVAECLREMQRQDSETIPVDVAMAILEEKLRQRNVAPEDRVRVPLRELPLLEMAIKKFAADNAFTIRNLIDVERKLSAPITYSDEQGELRERLVTGTLDALISAPPDEAVVFDAKFTWALPPEREPDAENPGISYLGYFQQVLYAYLVLVNYSSVQAVTTREFYPRRTKARSARIVRADLPEITRRLSILVENVDAALAAGPPARLRLVELEKHGHWKPSPGKHCFNCAKAMYCPLDDEYTDGGIRTPEDAERLAAVRQQARSIAKRVTTWCEGWVELHGPIPVKRAKGRLVLGHRKIKGGTRFEEFTPEGSDRLPNREAYNPALVDAMKASTEEARRQRAERVA